MIGRRTNTIIDFALEFDNEGTWEDVLHTAAENIGELYDTRAVDYFAFRRGSISILPFAVGRMAWDSWLSTHALRTLGYLSVVCICLFSGLFPSVATPPKESVGWRKNHLRACYGCPCFFVFFWVFTLRRPLIPPSNSIRLTGCECCGPGGASRT